MAEKGQCYYGWLSIIEKNVGLLKRLSDRVAEVDCTRAVAYAESFRGGPKFRHNRVMSQTSFGFALHF